MSGIVGKRALSRGQIIIKMSVRNSNLGVSVIANSFDDYLHSWLYIAEKSLWRMAGTGTLYKGVPPGS